MTLTVALANQSLPACDPQKLDYGHSADGTGTGFASILADRIATTGSAGMARSGPDIQAAADRRGAPIAIAFADGSLFGRAVEWAQLTPQSRQPSPEQPGILPRQTARHRIASPPAARAISVLGAVSLHSWQGPAPSPGSVDSAPGAGASTTRGQEDLTRTYSSNRWAIANGADGLVPVFRDAWHTKQDLRAIVGPRESGMKQYANPEAAATRLRSAISSSLTSQRAEFVAQLLPVSVTLHSGSLGLHLVARISGSDTAAEISVERLTERTLKESGYNLSGLTLNGKRTNSGTRRS